MAIYEQIVAEFERQIQEARTLLTHCGYTAKAKLVGAMAFARRILAHKNESFESDSSSLRSFGNTTTCTSR